MEKTTDKRKTLCRSGKNLPESFITALLNASRLHESEDEDDILTLEDIEAIIKAEEEFINGETIPMSDIDWS